MALFSELPNLKVVVEVNGEGTGGEFVIGRDREAIEGGDDEPSATRVPDDNVDGVV